MQLCLNLAFEFRVIASRHLHQPLAIAKEAGIANVLSTNFQPFDNQPIGNVVQHNLDKVLAAVDIRFIQLQGNMECFTCTCIQIYILITISNTQRHSISHGFDMQCISLLIRGLDIGKLLTIGKHCRIFYFIFHTEGE